MGWARGPGALAAPVRMDARQALLATSLGALAVASWSVLWWWSASPYGGLLHQAGWGDTGAFAQLCALVPQGEIVVPAALHAVAWLLMLAAMMLPTTYPLLAMFRRITGGRPDGARLTLLVVGGSSASGSRSGWWRTHSMRDWSRLLRARRG